MNMKTSNKESSQCFDSQTLGKQNSNAFSLLMRHTQAHSYKGLRKYRKILNLVIQTHIGTHE